MSNGESGSLRSAMPEIAAWIDELRAAFGREAIDKQIRRGMRGEPVFYAAEGEHSIGTPIGSRGELMSMPIPKAKEGRDADRRRRA